MKRARLFFSLSLLFAAPSLTACSGASALLVSSDAGSPAPPASDAGSIGDDDAAPNADGGALADAGPLAACPTSGLGAYAAPGTCALISPAQSGADPTGQNANVASYAITADPSVSPSHELVVWLHGSGGRPGAIPDPTRNVYAAAASAGHDVLAIAYVSDVTVAGLCKLEDACYFPTRASILLGAPQPGVATALAGITRDEGVARRVVLALRALAARDPSARWSEYLASGAGDDDAPETELAWSKMIVAGHSQGGGHAAALGKMFGVARVIQLSSTCDAVRVTGAPASWTASTNGPWATDPAGFYGFAAPTTFDAAGKATGGDTTCPAHAAVWSNLQMAADHRHDDAATCGNGGDTHGASVSCTDNYPAWVSLFR